MDVNSLYNNNFVAILGWGFLPTVVGYIQSILYGIFIRAGDPKPQPGSERYIIHRRRIHILVLVTYVLFNIYEADWSIRQKGNLYQDLGVPHDALDRKIQSKFRQMTLLFHPDKVPHAQKEIADARFVQIKIARDTLLDEHKRYAYDRFGPSILSPSWKHCISYWDFIRYGVTQSLITYSVTGSLVIASRMLGKFDYGFFWRMISIFALVAFEAYIAVTPGLSPSLGYISNPVTGLLGIHKPLLPFQLTSVLRKAVFAILVAAVQSQAVPAHPSQPQAADIAADNKEQQHQQLNRLAQVSSALNSELNRLLGLEGAPFKGNEAEQRKLQGSVKTWIVQNTIRNEPEVRDLVGRELQKRREGAPAGARGTR